MPSPTEGVRVNNGYAVFCDADAHFYDAPHRRPHRGAKRTEQYAAALAPVPPGWQRHTVGDRLAPRPVDHPLHGVTAGALAGAFTFLVQSLLPALRTLMAALATAVARLLVVLERFDRA